MSEIARGPDADKANGWTSPTYEQATADISTYAPGWIDAVEQGCTQFNPVRDQKNEHGRHCFTAFTDIDRAHVTVSLSSAAMRECVRVFIEPAEDHRVPQPTPSGIVHPASEPTALHLCRCMASELRDALNRAFADYGSPLEEEGKCPS